MLLSLSHESINQDNLLLKHLGYVGNPEKRGLRPVEGQIPAPVALFTLLSSG